VNAAQLKYTDTAGVVSGVGLSTNTGAAATAGAHTITASGGTAANYNVTTGNGTLTVSKAALTVSADDKAKVYGDADPALSYTVNAAQLKYTDTAGVVSGVGLSTNTGAVATAGTHTITATGGTAANYTITTGNGTLTVSKAALTATADAKAKVYGDADPALSYTVNAAQLKYTDTAGVVSGVGLSTNTGAAATAGTHTITASGGTAANYNVTTGNGTLTVSKAALTVTADDKARLFGLPNPPFSAAYEGLKYGESPAAVGAPAYSTPAVTLSTPGAYPIVPGALNAANYSVVYKPGVLTVKPVVSGPVDSNQLSAVVMSPIMQAMEFSPRPAATAAVLMTFGNLNSLPATGAGEGSDDGFAGGAVIIDGGSGSGPTVGGCGGAGMVAQMRCGR
jgi:hypothetical protein